MLLLDVGSPHILTGALDDVPTNRVEEFEKSYLDHLRTTHPELLAKVRVDKKWSDELAAEFDRICAAQVKEFTA